ncbi:TetR family transcriptional regulator [Cupriavidus malaysiensis]|uniref:TetR family transcriptional regulator n=2 Tax=Cupriavidus malaysiensis TaxID=367825 RepID=A0ABM7D854_9BURK|nr:TetR family transcriptional regulator [Cupriavidus malaysiensis]
MRYSETHKRDMREKLLDSSSAIAKKGGFGTTGVDALMSAIGLTGGAFYGHFPSKDALFAAIVARELEHSAQMLAGDEQAPPDHVARCLRRYLSDGHAEHPESGCVLPALGAEIARAGPGVRAEVEAALRRLQEDWRDRVGDADAAWALLAQCVGAILLARVVESPQTRHEILAASRRFLETAIDPQPGPAGP